MRIHLATLVGSHVDVLPFMLGHYREQGVTDVSITAHLRDGDDPLIDEIRATAADYNCEVEATVFGEWQMAQKTYLRPLVRRARDDWWLFADQDELHYFPDRLASILDYCDRCGYDVIRGAFIDRIAADGTFPPISPDAPLSTQFPLGGWLSPTLLGASPLKVVAAKGRVPISIGHHEAHSTAACPIDDVFVQIHHFKWTSGVMARLRARAESYRRLDIPHWVESQRIVDYCDAHEGRIDVSDARLLLAPCLPAYPYWDVVRHLVALWRPDVTGGSRS